MPNLCLCRKTDYAIYSKKLIAYQVELIDKCY